jgi:hypothetical protein
MTNVIKLFNHQKNITRQVLRPQENTKLETNEIETTFLDIVEQNRLNQERLRKERNQANKNILKSYKLK